VAALVLLAGRAARAHDPFEITTDAHVSEGGTLTLHTTMSLPTASRACLDGTGAPVTAREFALLVARFEACARGSYDVRAGGASLRPLGARAALTVEEDVEMWVTFPRPAKSPLVFDAVGLRRLPARAGVVLTVTGARTFLGQKVLRPDDPTFEIPITEEAEAPGTSPASPPRQSRRRR